MFSAPYRFRRLTLDSANVLLTLIPGLALLHSRRQITFALGAAIALTRSQIEQIGGWQVLSDYLVEDYQLGHLLAQKNVPVALASSVAQFDNDPLTALQLFH